MGRGGRRGAVWVAAWLVAAALPLLGSVEPAGGATANIVSRGVAVSATYAANSTTAFTLGVPVASQPGDLLVAVIGFVRSGSKAQPALSPPGGWTVISSTAHDSTSALSVYWHLRAAGETSYAFTATVPVGGTAFLSAFGGVDPAHPVDAAAGQNQPKGGKTIVAPGVTTSVPNTMLVTAYTGYRAKGSGTTWTSPPGMTEVGDAGNGSSSGSVDVALQPGTGSTGSRAATPSNPQDWGIGVLVALRPAPVSATGPVPLIVDTDLFSDVDDVGALATAFGLQIQGEARVVAVVVNTRTSRPTVAADSWRCVAAITQFYGSGSVPIGADPPADGTDKNTVDFAGPCAALAPPTPVPDPAVTVYRRALAAQADGTVTIASIGYLENLADLLASPPDDASPLTGLDLVARKVKLLVVMGGGYPSRAGENNLAGDAAAAQTVAAQWPTKLVWSGYEVGDAIHVGATISGTHPPSSPVRVAYEAFVGPNNWVYGYDEAAVYHAVRPNDGLLTEVGPGTNSIDSSGGNVFTQGPGNQAYLQLTDANALDASVDSLLDTLPPGAAPQ